MDEQHEKQQLRTKIKEIRVRLMDVRLVKVKSQTHMKDLEAEVEKMEKDVLQVVIKKSADFQTRRQLKTNFRNTLNEFDVLFDVEKEIFDENVDFALTSSSALQSDTVKHEQEAEADPLRPFVCDEVGCDKRFTLKGNMKNHVFRVHRTQIRAFICLKPNCIASFKTKGNLSGHIKYRHGKRTLSCQQPGCDKMFINEVQHKLHQVTHTNDKHIKCLVEGCGKRFKTSKCLFQHTRQVHSIEKPFKCELDGCGMRFVSAWHRNTHQRRHGDKTIGCDDCDMRFFTRSALNGHKRRHHSEDKPFKCDFEGCEKQFVTVYECTVHNRSHTGEKPHSCVECGKQVSLLGNLRRHERFHSGLKTFACPKCSKTFVLAQSRDRHEKICNVKPLKTDS